MLKTHINFLSKFEEKEKLFEQLLVLSNKNKKTLGMIPAGALRQMAHDGLIIIVEKEDNLLGYLIFRYTKRSHRLAISQLCIENDQRGENHSSSLLIFFKEHCRSIDASGIFLKCRIDYVSASRLWEREEFIAINESPGRGSPPKPLVHWWWGNPNSSDLFSNDFLTDSHKLLIGIDHNVIISLNDNDQTNIQMLQSDWIKDEIDLVIMPESYNEILRHNNKERRDKIREFMHSLNEINHDENLLSNYKAKLLELLPKSKTIQDISDAHQLAYCAASRCNYFITNDKKVLNLASEIAEITDLYVCNPVELTIHLDEKIQDSKYTPSRLAGTQNIINSVCSSDYKNLSETFINDYKGEKLTHLNEIIEFHVLNSDNGACLLNSKDEYSNSTALVAYQLNIKNELVIGLLRLTKNNLASTLIYQILENLLSISRRENTDTITVSDKYADDYATALISFGFTKHRDNWIKYSYREIFNLNKPNELKDVIHQPTYKKIISLAQSNEKDELIKLEKKHRPLKIRGLDLPTYIIPIKPHWASELFDSEIAEEDLFGATASVAFNITNVYYTASNVKFETPARILWYVSSKGNSQYSGAIRACSYIEKSELNKPKELFKKNKRLGIYSWDDIYKCANNNINKSITAITFSHTELLQRPISHSDSLNLFHSHNLKSNNFVGPLKVTEDFYFDIYYSSAKSSTRYTNQ